MMRTEMVVRRSLRVVSQRLVGEQGTVLLHLDSSACFNLNEVGALIWDVIADPVGVEQLHHRVAAAFDASPGSLETDVSEFLHHLAERGLIELQPAPPRD